MPRISGDRPDRLRSVCGHLCSCGNDSRWFFCISHAVLGASLCSQCLVLGVVSRGRGEAENAGTLIRSHRRQGPRAEDNTCTAH